MIDPKYAAFESEVRDAILDSHFGGHCRVLQALLAHPDVADAVSKARAAGVPWMKILAILLPIALSIFTGGAIDIPAIIAAILALFGA